MPIETFTGKDFRVFDLVGFAERMAAIRARIRAKLEQLGRALTPELSELIGVEIFLHVARHARRTVNPRDDTWVAFGPDRRGYKEAAHFKVAVSRHCVRLLFEIGPEYAAKPAWARAWKRDAPRYRKVLAGTPGLGWFKNEHDEEPAATLPALDAPSFTRLGEEITRTRDGQLVIGRRVEADEAARWTGADHPKAAVETFAALRGCFTLR